MRLATGVVTGLSMLVLHGCCTQIGCVNNVFFELGASASHFAPGEPVEVRACLDTDCVNEVLTLPVDGNVAEGDRLTLLGTSLSYLPANGMPAGKHTVTLDLSRQGTVVLSESREVVVTPRTPNGPFCAPVCSSAGVTL